MSGSGGPGGQYADKKAFFDRVLTLYGRKPVLEALRDGSLDCHALHLADSNRGGGIIADILAAAKARGIDVRYHTRESLARISRNGKQDQGVALDVLCPAFRGLAQYLADGDRPDSQRLIALDGITNPQNLGMLLRSCAAGAVDGIILPTKGTAALGPLVAKASAGTLYRAPVLRCDIMEEALAALQGAGATICTLAGDASDSLFGFDEPGFVVYVLGNETDGVSPAVQALADRQLSIPMRNGVESLNVAVAASLVAFAPGFRR